MQHDYDIANAPGATIRSDLNNAVQSLATNNSGASAPSPTYANMWWPDTTNNVLKQRNAANTAWIIKASLDAARVEAKSATFNIGVDDTNKLFKCTAASSYSITLSAVATLGDAFSCVIKNESSYTLTIDPDSSETINSATTLDLLEGQSAIIYCDGSELIAVIVSSSSSELSLPYGLLPSNDADTDHDINFTAGRIIDDSNSVMITLSSEITKQADATFAEGDDAGGMVSGESLPTSGTIHCWLISKTDGTTDICFNNHATSGLSPTLPSGYVNKRRIASFRTDSSANIYNFNAFNDHGNRLRIDYLDKKHDLSSSTTTTQSLRTLTVPQGIKVLATISHAMRIGTSQQTILILSPDQTDNTPTIGNANWTYTVDNPSGSGVCHGQCNMEVMTNTSGQIGTRCSGSGYNEHISTNGFTDLRV